MPNRASGEVPATPDGYRMKVLNHLRMQVAALGVSAQRLQQRVAFERLLTRLSPDHWIVKGGFALELRYGWRGRPTRDIDLSTAESPDAALVRLVTDVRRGDRTAIDHFTFELYDDHLDLHGAPGGGRRLRVVARLAGMVLTRFALDLGSGDAMVDAADILECSDLLAPVGLTPVSFPVYPLAQHLAEKLHAYTLPRERENSRIKDLLDIALIASNASLDGDSVTLAARATFAARATHRMPDVLSPPPTTWAG